MNVSCRTFEYIGIFFRVLSRQTASTLTNQLVLRHRDTLMALSCEKGNVEPTDFGAEFEVKRNIDIAVASTRRFR